MANKKIFNTTNTFFHNPDTTNLAGGKAFNYEPKHKLAQLICTGTFNGTFYADEATILKLIQETLESIDDLEFIAKVAIYARYQSYLKDTPAFLVAWLNAKTTSSNKQLFHNTFRKVINNGKMLRNYYQIGLSGAVGKKLIMNNSSNKKAFQEFFDRADNQHLLNWTVGEPKLSVLIKSTRPTPKDATRDEFFKYILGKEYNINKLPKNVKEFEKYKVTRKGPLPNVDFRLLDNLQLNKKEWTQLALNGNFHFIRMNLNTFGRHGLWKNKQVIKDIVAKLTDKDAIRASKVYPYQLMASYLNVDDEVPIIVKNALQDAMEIATENVPVLPGYNYICIDVSGSMNSPITGHRKGSTSKVRCVDVAALFGASFLRKNAESIILPFDTSVYEHLSINPKDSIMTNAKKLTINGGGTNCSVALDYILFYNPYKVDNIIFVSDNASWVDRNAHMNLRWNEIKQRNKKAKLICIDVTPYGTSQVKPNSDILQIGGWSDTIFDVVANFCDNSKSKDFWIQEIEKVDLGI